MRFPHGPGGLGLFGSVFTDILAGLVFIILFVVAVGVLFVLVRFLVVATKAAEVYIAKNSSTGATTPTVTPAATATPPRARVPKTPTV